MAGFRPYQHIEKLGHREVQGILEGVVTIYPKLDGTNASVWWPEDGGVAAGSRRREITVGNDNHGFCHWVQRNEGLYRFMLEQPHLRLYGEWLVPHSLKSYREDAWRRFWVYDVWDERAKKLYPAEDYRQKFEEHGIDYIMPIARIRHPDEGQLIYNMNKINTFLMQDGAGPGEGIVLKRYDDWTNAEGNQVWAKMVRNEFKERNKKVFFDDENVTAGKRVVEADIVDEFCTEALVKKELAKIIHELANDEPLLEDHSSEKLIEHYRTVMMTNRRTVIPRLLQTVFYTLIKEEGWEFVKKFKNPTIDFKKLNRLVASKVKASAPELF